MSWKRGGELFLRSAKSYLDALTAIAAFQSEVQEMCEEKYKRYSSELAAQMGLSAEDCSPHEESNASERWAEIGVKRPAQQDCFFYIYVSWGEDEKDDKKIAANVSLDLYPKRFRDEIFEGFRQQRPSCRVKKLDAYTYQLVLTENLTDLASTRNLLDALLVEWLGYCKSIGGLKLQARKSAAV
jgi:hypothetical protein